MTSFGGHDYSMRMYHVRDELQEALFTHIEEHVSPQPVLARMVMLARELVRTVEIFQRHAPTFRNMWSNSGFPVL